MSTLIQELSKAAADDIEAEEWQKTVEAICRKFRTPARDRISFTDQDDFFADECEGEGE